jgi:hypothetical protein
MLVLPLRIYDAKFPMTKDELLDRLKTAGVCCASCGDRYGTPRGRYSSWWVSRCEVCDNEGPVTEVRDYKYLNRGIVELVEGVKSR